jgi:hypothetical protein
MKRHSELLSGNSEKKRLSKSKYITKFFFIAFTILPYSNTPILPQMDDNINPFLEKAKTESSGPKPFPVTL